MKLCLLLCLIPGMVLGQQIRGGVKADSSSTPVSTTSTYNPTKERLALVIGNWKYVGNALINPENDAKDIRKTLENSGFDVMYYENLGAADMETAVSEFTAELKNYRVGLFYFAGHGFESKAKINYLMSTDIKRVSNEAFAKEKSLSLDAIVESMNDAPNPTDILIIDACRTNPFRSWGRSEALGLGAMNAPEGTIVFFAASPGQAADENPGGNNGLFTQELIKQMKIPNLEFSQILKNTSREVKKINGWQLPYSAGQLLDDFYFRQVNIPGLPPLEPGKAVNIETLRLQKARYKKRRLIDYGLALVGVAAGAITYLTVTEKYNNYLIEAKQRNLTYSNWYSTNYAGAAPPNDDLLAPVSKSSFAATSLVGAGLAFLGGAALFVIGNKNTQKYKLIDAELKKQTTPLSVRPLLNPIQGWGGVSVGLRF